MSVTPTGPGCQPTASAAKASSQSDIPNADAYDRFIEAIIGELNYWGQLGVSALQQLRIIA